MNLCEKVWQSSLVFFSFEFIINSSHLGIPSKVLNYSPTQELLSLQAKSYIESNAEHFQSPPEEKQVGSFLMRGVLNL